MVDKKIPAPGKNKPKPTPNPVPKGGDPKRREENFKREEQRRRNDKIQKGPALKPKGNSAVSYNVRVKTKGPANVMRAAYTTEKRTVKTSRGR
jgi:hypothetical protein